MLDEFPRRRWTWTTLRANARVSLTFEDLSESADLVPVAVSIERIDGGSIRSRDVLDVAEAFDTERDSSGSVTQLGLVDELRQLDQQMRSRRVEHVFSVDDLRGLTDADRKWAKENGLGLVTTFSAPHPLEVARDVRSSRPRKRIEVTDEVLEDIASIYRQYGQRGYTRVLMERFGWQKEHAQRMKGRAVAEGFLPEVEDGRGRKSRQEKKSRGKKS